jgi:hypothetical protein
MTTYQPRSVSMRWLDEIAEAHEAVIGANTAVANLAGLLQQYSDDDQRDYNDDVAYLFTRDGLHYRLQALRLRLGAVRDDLEFVSKNAYDPAHVTSDAKMLAAVAAATREHAHRLIDAILAATA